MPNPPSDTPMPLGPAPALDRVLIPIASLPEHNILIHLPAFSATSTVLLPPKEPVRRMPSLSARSLYSFSLNGPVFCSFGKPCQDCQPKQQSCFSSMSSPIITKRPRIQSHIQLIKHVECAAPSLRGVQRLGAKTGRTCLVSALALDALDSLLRLSASSALSPPSDLSPSVVPDSRYL